MRLRPAISGLVIPGSPAAIRRRVVAIVVNPFQSQSWRAPAHIRDKVFKVFPLKTHLDASTSVVFPGMIAQIAAPFAHRRPYSIFRPRVISPGRAMLQAVRVSFFEFSHSVAMEAPAASRVISSKIRAANGDTSTAIALTSPARMFRAVLSSPLQDNQPSESLPAKVF